MIWTYSDKVMLWTRKSDDDDDTDAVADESRNTKIDIKNILISGSQLSYITHDILTVQYNFYQIKQVVCIRTEIQETMSEFQQKFIIPTCTFLCTYTNCSFSFHLIPIFFTIAVNHFIFT